MYQRVKNWAASAFVGLSVSAFSFDGALSEPVNEVVIGGHYFVKGFFEDTKVQVVSVDKVGNRVKIYDPSSQNVDWVDADAVITRSESVDRDLDRIQVGARILAAIFDAASSNSSSSAPAPEPRQPWTPGVTHASISNVVAGNSRDEWLPKPGYAWAKDGSRKVEWTPGLAHPTQAHIVSSYEQEKWATEVQFLFQKLQLEGKQKDEARKDPYPNPPDVSGLVFEPGEMDVYCRTDLFDSLSFFHAKNVDYQELRHVIFHGDENWVVVVHKNGQRQDLGAKITWQARPCFAFSTGVVFERTRDGISQESRRIPLLRIDSNHEVVEKYLLGIRFDKELKSTPAGDRMVISTVLDQSAALEAGLKKGDEIVSIDGVQVKSVQRALEVVNYKSGSAVPVEYARDGKTALVQITPRIGYTVAKRGN